MQVLDSIDKIAPKSILRYRPIDGNPEHPKKRAFVIAAKTPSVARASRLLPKVAATEDVDTVVEHPSRSGNGTNVIADHSSLGLPISWMSSALHRVVGVEAKSLVKPHKQSRSIIFYLLVGMVVTLLLGVMFSLFAGWARTWVDDIHYGRPRTFQTDVRVGHNHDQTGIPSHFIAINLNRNIEVIEFPGGDRTQVRDFAGPQFYGENDNLVPVTLSFVDLNQDKKLDMVINFQNQHTVYINDGKSFRPSLPSEQAEIEQALQRLGM